MSFLPPSSNPSRSLWVFLMSFFAHRIAPAVYVQSNPSISFNSISPTHSLTYPPTFLTQAYPDVSAQSRRFLIFYTGLPALISGTSASAPTFAGIVALLNDATIAAGKPTLGFLNPMLYSIGVEGLNDITEGNAPGCGTPGFNVSSLFFFFLGMGLTYYIRQRRVGIP